MKLEVRIPISATASFIRRVPLIAQSIYQFYPDTFFQAYVGGTTEPGAAVYRIIHESDFSLRKSGTIEWHEVPHSQMTKWEGTAHPYIATMMERYKPPFHGDYVLMLDADVLCIRPFRELFTDKLSAVMAHVPPFPAGGWKHLFERFGVVPSGQTYELSGWRTMVNEESHRWSPPYFNTGVVCAPAKLLEGLYETYMEALEFVRTQMNSYFFEQIALTLAIEKLQIPVNVLPLRYNFPNQPDFDRMHADELADVRLLHFLRHTIVDRDKDFASPEAIEAFIKRTDLTGSNEILREHVACLIR